MLNYLAIIIFYILISKGYWTLGVLRRRDRGKPWERFKDLENEEIQRTKKDDRKEDGG